MTRAARAGIAAGMGFCRRCLITRDDVSFATYGDRFAFGPQGLFGGAPGERARSYVLRAGKRIPIGSVEKDLAQGFIGPRTARRVYRFVPRERVSA